MNLLTPDLANLLTPDLVAYRGPRVGIACCPDERTRGFLVSVSVFSVRLECGGIRVSIERYDPVLGQAWVFLIEWVSAPYVLT